MLRYAVAWLSTAVVFVALDAVWLTNMGSWYRAALGELMAPDFRFAPAAVFYVLFLTGLVVFAVGPALGEGRAMVALVQGALFGFFTYATYDLTNQATLARWPLKLTLVDLAWGTTLSAASATIGFFIASAILARFSAP